MGRPLPGAMQHTQDLDRAPRDSVYNHIVRMHHHFAGAPHPPRAIKPRMLRQPADTPVDRVSQLDRGNRVVLGDVLDYGVAVSLSGGPPENSQAFAPCAALDFFRSCERFLRQRAETSSWGMPGRGSSSAACTWLRNHMS